MYTRQQAKCDNNRKYPSKNAGRKEPYPGKKAWGKKYKNEKAISICNAKKSEVRVGGKKPDAPCLFEYQNPRLRLKKEREKKKNEVAWAKAAICMKYLQYRVVDEQLISFPTAIGTSVVASGDGS